MASYTALLLGCLCQESPVSGRSAVSVCIEEIPFWQLRTIIQLTYLLLYFSPRVKNFQIFGELVIFQLQFTVRIKLCWRRCAAQRLDGPRLQ